MSRRMFGNQRKKKIGGRSNVNTFGAIWTLYSTVWQSLFYQFFLLQCKHICDLIAEIYLMHYTV